MILFDNTDILSVANVDIEDIKVSAIEYEQVARNRAIAPGSLFVRSRPGTRTVTVTFALLSQSMANRQASLDAIRAWAKSDRQHRLELPGHPDHYLWAVCTDKPSPSLRQWWEGKLKLVFTCYDNPFWNARTEKSVACGTAFKVLGVEPLMRIERTLSSSASNQAYSDGTNTMTFSTIPAGNMVIDLNNQTAKVGSSSIMQYYNVNSKWIIPKSGDITITGTGTVKYKERFE